ncbi:MAG: pilus assembly protein [Firmicutes bacterium]|nr:pilus assembly protein [Bacillota bacterium]
MINNKGQTLVIFAVFLPLLLIIMATVIDVSLMYYEKNKLDNINLMVIEYGIDHLEENDLEIKLKELIKENDKEIKMDNITINDNKITIIISKSTKSTFGKIIGIENYKITSKYIGIINKEKKEIKKG